MTSKAVLDDAIGVLPKAAAFLLPLVYSTWKKARLRPVVAVQRQGGRVVLQTTAKEPIEKLAIRLTRPGIVEADVTCQSKGFTGCELQQVSPSEVRVCFERFGQYDTIDVQAPSPLTVDVIDSPAIPVEGRSHPLLWVLDWAVLLAAISVLAVLIIGPIEERLTDMNTYQSQDNVDHQLRELIFRIVWGFLTAGGLLLAETMLVTSRRRRALVIKTLKV
jgi:hypothetical protein